MARLERLPLFLLNTVLYPEQRLPLRVFEARYMDMVTDSLTGTIASPLSVTRSLPST